MNGPEHLFAYVLLCIITVQPTETEKQDGGSERAGLKERIV